MAPFALSAYRQPQFSSSPRREIRGRAYAVETPFVPAKTRIDLGLRCVSSDPPPTRTAMRVLRPGLRCVSSDPGLRCVSSDPCPPTMSITSIARREAPGKQYLARPDQVA